MGCGESKIKRSNTTPIVLKEDKPENKKVNNDGWNDPKQPAPKKRFEDDWNYNKEPTGIDTKKFNERLNA